MSKSNLNANDSRSAGRERQGEDILQVRRKQKHGQSLVPGRSTRHTRRERPALIPGPPPRGAAPVRRAKKAAKRATHTAARRKGAAKEASTNTQASDKRGKRSAAQKRASLRHGFTPIPATSRVAGAFGKEPSLRRRTARQGDVVDR